MKTIALIMGLTFAALAQQPKPSRLYFNADIPMAHTIDAPAKRCPNAVTVTFKPETAQYQLDFDWYYTRFLARDIHYTATLYKINITSAWEPLAEFYGEVTKKNWNRAYLPFAENICKFFTSEEPDPQPVDRSLSSEPPASSPREPGPDPTLSAPVEKKEKSQSN
jgi:hypothetical protein